MEEIPNLAKAFGQALRAYREQARLTQEELAERVGSVSSYIRFLEYGQRVPTITTFHRLCNALQVDPHEFMSQYLQSLARMQQK